MGIELTTRACEASTNLPRLRYLLGFAGLEGCLDEFG